jgi:hypothetical protein
LPATIFERIVFWFKDTGYLLTTAAGLKKFKPSLRNTGIVHSAVCPDFSRKGYKDYRKEGEASLA